METRYFGGRVRCSTHIFAFFLLFPEQSNRQARRRPSSLHGPEFFFSRDAEAFRLSDAPALLSVAPRTTVLSRVGNAAAAVVRGLLGRGGSAAAASRASERQEASPPIRGPRLVRRLPGPAAGTPAAGVKPPPGTGSRAVDAGGYARVYLERLRDSWALLGSSPPPPPSPPE